MHISTRDSHRKITVKPNPILTTVKAWARRTKTTQRKLLGLQSYSTEGLGERLCSNITKRKFKIKGKS